MTESLSWQQITTRAGARILQTFTCTTDLPQTPGGRKLPHPRPWEWEAQRHLRQLSQLLRPGDRILVAVASGEVVGCTHLQFVHDDDLLEVFVAATGVAIAVRGTGGGTADQLLGQTLAVGLERASELGCAHLVLTGNVHVDNRPSQRMAARARWEPYGVPSDGYQTWALITPM